MPLFEPTEEGIKSCKHSIKRAKEKIAQCEGRLFEEKQGLEFYERWLKELTKETDEQRQKRFKCNQANGIRNWRCKIDCAFWNGQKCDKYESEEAEEETT